MDLVFKALADPSRRLLLDRLHERNGQTLGELCGHLEMTRQSATQHLEILEAANLVATVRRGREKLHYLNPVPLQEIEERWIDKFERPRLRTLRAVKRGAEEAMTDKPEFVYVVYIESTPERVWQALTDADLAAEYWGHSNASDWQAGSPGNTGPASPTSQGRWSKARRPPAWSSRGRSRARTVPTARPR